MKKRLTITLSDSVLENLEKMAKEMGLSKSAMISVALENYKKGQVINPHTVMAEQLIKDKIAKSVK